MAVDVIVSTLLSAVDDTSTPAKVSVKSEELVSRITGESGTAVRSVSSLKIACRLENCSTHARDVPASVSGEVSPVCAGEVRRPEAWGKFPWSLRAHPGPDI